MSANSVVSKEKKQLRFKGEIPEKVDVAIVGAGMGGLMAGAYLSKNGYKVACFDHHYVAGGCTTHFARGFQGDKYHFDVGLHYIGDCGPEGAIPRLLRGVGVEIEYQELDPDGFDTLVFPDFTFKIPSNVELYRERLIEMFPKEKKGIDRYLRLMKEVDDVGGAFEKNNNKMSLNLALKVLTSGRLLARYQNATMAEFLDSCTNDIRLRAILLGQHGDYALPPSEVSVLLHLGLANHYFKGAYYPVGGGQVLSNELADVIEANGGSIHLRCGIDKILVEDGQVVGVRTEPKRDVVHEIRANQVICNADIKRMTTDLLDPNDLPPTWVKRVEGFKMAGALFMTCLSVDTDMREKGMRATNYWQSDHYDVEAAYQSFKENETPSLSGCYITSATLKDPGNVHHAPEGTTNIEVMSLVPGNFSKWGVKPEEIDNWDYKKNERYLDIKNALEEDSIRRLEELFPGTKEHILFKESATPITQTRYTRASGGTSYGISATPDQFLKQRPGFRGPLKQLYLCGASTRSGHGIVGAMNSGLQAARRVAKDQGKLLSEK